jgi:hypothetical protein
MIYGDFSDLLAEEDLKAPSVQRFKHERALE